MKVKQISVVAKRRGRPPRTRILIDNEQKKKREKEQKKLDEQKCKEEMKKKCEEEKKKLDDKKREEEKKIEEQKYEEEKKRLEETFKRFLEEKAAEEEKKREKKKLDEEKKVEEKKKNEKKKLEQKKKEDDEKKREEKKKQILQSSWGTTSGQDNYTRGRSRNRNHSRSEFDRRERNRDYRMRRDNPSRSPSRFRSTERLFQPLSHDLEIQQLHAKVRELENIVAQGKLQGSKEPLSNQCTGPYPVKSSYEETDLLKLKNRLKYYQKNNSDLKQKLDYANKKIAQLQREQSACYCNYQNQTDYSQQMQNSNYLNHHQNQQEFYY